ncbi:MAG: hypothetical protein ACK41E_10520 [Deinococcales bacterium]
MADYIHYARQGKEVLEHARQMTKQYWESFERDPLAGRVSTEAGPKIVLPAKILAVDLFNALDQTLGEVGSNLVLYGIGKTWGRFSAEHFKNWAQKHGFMGEAVKYGALFFPMHVGLTPRLELTEVTHRNQQYFVAQVIESVLSESRKKNGLDTEPAHWLVSGWLAGCISGELGLEFEARAIPNSGETSYRVLIGTAIGSVDLQDPFWTSDLSALETILVHT